MTSLRPAENDEAHFSLTSLRSSGHSSAHAGPHSTSLFFARLLQAQQGKQYWNSIFERRCVVLTFRGVAGRKSGPSAPGPQFLCKCFVSRVDLHPATSLEVSKISQGKRAEDQGRFESDITGSNLSFFDRLVTLS